MSFEKLGRGRLDYQPCRYGDARLMFRGPRRDLSGRYTLFIGGTETYGKFLARPFPALVEEATGRTCVNFGCVNAGVDAFLGDPHVLEVAQRAEVVVVQILGAHNMSNRFYRVHPRRNDRFLDASPVMKSVFPEIDFTEFHFTRHMLGTLSARAPERYLLLRDELRQAWVARMRLLLNSIPGRKHLLWFTAQAPENLPPNSGLGGDPLFIDRAMVDTLRPQISGLVEVVASAEALQQGSRGMVYDEMEKMSARRMLGPLAHAEAAAALVAALA
ncbi:DUF6473 family protein [Shimia sp.]|uniref:DUF6473 family protein n=1 Tax=Shimia sp. TaxID=1954381 RepID=UPI003566A5AD